MSLSSGELLGRYRIEAQVGSGGMGTVYRAFDERLQRDVAIKLLNDTSLTDRTTIARFKREAKAVAGLSHANIVALHDFEEQDGVAYAVMELLEGETLDKRLAREQLSDPHVYDVAESVVRGLDAAHRSGVIHRDVKPSNIFLTEDGQVKLLDFGLATARARSISMDGETVVTDEPGVGGPSTDDLETGIGTIMGTVGYMSPEQVRGDPTDQRSDIFSFGAVLFEMATGSRAFDRDTSVETMTAILNDPVPEESQVELPRSHPLFPVTEACLAKKPDARFQSADQLLADLRRARASTAAVKVPSRSVVVPVVIVLAVVLVGVLIAFSDRNPSETAATPVGGGDDRSASESAAPASGQSASALQDRSRRETLPRLLDLAREGRDVEAFALAQPLQSSLGDDPVFRRVWDDVTLPLSITTEPPGASVEMRDYDATDDGFHEIGQSPIEGLRISRSAKVLRIRKPGFRTRVIAGEVEIIARATAQAIVLDAEDAIPAGMVRVTAGSGFPLTGMPFGFSGDPEKAPSNVRSFLMDRHEVTNREFGEFVRAGGYTNSEYWTDPITKDGETVDPTTVSKLFVDATGRPGPATWEVGSYPNDRDDYPVQGVSWFEARAYARFVGKDLPTIYHWSRATPTLFADAWLGTLISRSNVDTESFAAVGAFPGLSPDGVYDLCGNVAEWAVNGVGGKRFSLGGSAVEKAYFFNHANAVDPLDRSPQRGFRCVQYTSESSPSEAQLADVRLESRDYETIPAVSDEVFAVYRNQFLYDETPLNPRVVYRRTDEYPDFIKERVEIDAAYDGERVILYVYLPRNAKPPFQTLVYFRNAGSIRPVSSEEFAHEPYPFIMKSGRALVHPVVKGTFERWDGLESWTSRPDQKYVDFLQKWVKDYLRTLDYVETREDLDATKLGYLGDSWGAFNGLIIPAIEPRLKLSVCYVGGLSMQQARPEVDQISYISRVKLPVLWLSGRYDPIFPLEQSALPAFRHLGTAPEHKRQVIYPTGHALPRQERIRETLDWLDTYFGAVN